MDGTKLIRKMDDTKKRAQMQLKKLQEDFEAEVEAEYKRKFPRRKYGIERSREENEEFHSKTYHKYVKMGIEIHDRKDKKIEEIENEIKAHIDEIVIPTTNKMFRHTTVSSSSYRSQGFGEHSYALRAAQEYVDHAKMFGVDGEVRAENISSGTDTCGFSWTLTYYHVWLKTTTVGFRLLKYKPVNILDWAVQCWKNNTNPKVYNPFLSDEIYEKSMAIHMGRE